MNFSFPNAKPAEKSSVIQYGCKLNCPQKRRRDQYLWKMPMNFIAGMGELGTCESPEQCQVQINHFDKKKVLDSIQFRLVAFLDHKSELMKPASGAYPQCPEWHSNKE